MESAALVSDAERAIASGDLPRAIELLTPAEAAKHVEHPNLWSWRRLAADSRPDSTFVAFLVRHTSDDVTNEMDRVFRWRLALDAEALGDAARSEGFEPPTF